jgi:hypothetical protein
MNKFVYFNDTNRIVSIHPATQTHGCEVDMSGIQPQTIREFILPEGTYAWVKMWDYGERGLQILVSPTSYEKNEGVRHEPTDPIGHAESIRHAMIQQTVKDLFKKRNPHDKKESIDSHEVPKRELSPHIQELLERSSKAMKKLKEDE